MFRCLSMNVSNELSRFAKHFYAILLANQMLAGLAHYDSKAFNCRSRMRIRYRPLKQNKPFKDLTPQSSCVVVVGLPLTSGLHPLGWTGMILEFY